mgnify:CR=1 FL=1|tara:strand:+ start:73642 stop:75600 length:1959 start_codon:yes stop_codon:yes gene_type:complete
MPFKTALSGLQAASSELRVIGNNIANASTTGFKQSRAEFADIYANSAFGSSGTAIGAGVSLASVKQQFSQGQISFSDNNLDLAISGQGFFITSQNGDLSYTRAGAFGVDKDGFITNASDSRLQGFLADGSGNITGTRGDLQISSANSAPQLTSNIGVKVNLNSAEPPPTVPFARGFTPSTPPDPNSFNASASTSVFDSLGNSYIQTTYFVKAPTQNTWNVYVGIDGSDVTAAAPAPPAGAPPVAYPTGAEPSPYTVVFDQTGNFVVNNPTVPPQYHGPGPVSSSASALSTSGSLPGFGLNDLSINGIAIDSSVTTSADTISTTDASSSAISIAAAVNASSQWHGVTATVTNTTLDLGVPTLGALAANDFTLNGVGISGPVASDADLLTLVNDQSTSTGVVATQPGGAGTAIILTASDGRNIQVQTDGTTAGATFANFNLNGGSALDRVKTGDFSLASSNNNPINIGGTTPGSARLLNGPQAGIVQTSSDVINITDWIPPSSVGGLPQPLSINLSQSTQYGSDFAVQGLTQDGFTTGRLAGVEISAEGNIVASYTNGQSTTLGQVVLANFGNTQGLSPQGDTSWGESFSSGIALVGEPGTASLGLIQSGSLEGSNVQLTEQLVALITSQRNFQANAQTIRTAEAVTQAIINLR